MYDITYSIRSYYRPQFFATMTAIFCAEILGDIYLSVPSLTKAKPTEEMNLLLQVLGHRGYYIQSEESVDGVGASLLHLLNMLYSNCRTEYILFIDDDVIFTRLHLEHIILHLNKYLSNAKRGIAYYTMGEADNVYNLKHIHASIGRRVAEPYCSLIRRQDLLSIPFSVFEPLQRYGAYAEVAYFSNVFRIYGFEFYPLRTMDRPYHLYIERQKEWSNYDIEESYLIIGQADSTVTIAELERCCDKIDNLIKQEKINNENS